MWHRAERKHALAAVVMALIMATVLTACGRGVSGPAEAVPPDRTVLAIGSGGGIGPVAIVPLRNGAGPTPTQPLDQAEAAAWLCQTQATALEQLMPRILASDSDLQARADRVLAWFQNKCSPGTADRDAEWVDLFHELNALPIPTPVVPSVGSVRNPN